MELEIPEVASKDLPSDKRFAREIGYGIQQTLACWATDFIDPPISKWLQNRYGVAVPPEDKVTNKHVFGAEALGDTSAFFIYIAAKRALTKPIDAITAGVRNVMDKRLTAKGKQSISHWSREMQVSEDDPIYKRKLEAYKDFQAENIVDSTIIATSATLTNVKFQRMLGNKQPMIVILGSKIIGAVITAATMLGARSKFPDSMRTLDQELDDKYFSHVIRFTKKAFGVNVDEPTPEEKERVKNKHQREALKIPPAPLLETGFTGMVGSMAAMKIANPEKELAHLIPHGAAIGAGAAGGTLLLRALLPKFSKTFNEEFRERYNHKHARAHKLEREKKKAERAEIAAHSVSLADAPLVETALTDTKHAALLGRLRQSFTGDANDPAAFEAFREEQKQINEAFIAALNPEGRFAKALTTAHFRALRKLDPNSDDARGRHSSMVGVQSVVIGRRDDMLAARKLLDDPAFLAELKNTLAQPAPQAVAAEDTSEALVESLVQTRGPKGREPAVHIYANARGQRIEHQALAEAFDPAGIAGEALTNELRARLPDLGNKVDRIASEYMQGRKHAAEKTVNALALDGEVVNEAVRRSEMTRQAGNKTAATFAERVTVSNNNSTPAATSL